MDGVLSPFFLVFSPINSLLAAPLPENEVTILHWGNIHTYIYTHIDTHIHTLLHSSPLGALPPYIYELKQNEIK